MTGCHNLCPSCGEPAEMNARFCGNCGTRLESPQAREHKRRNLVTAVAVLAVGVVTVGGWILLAAGPEEPQSTGPTLMNAEAVDLPAIPANVDDTRAFLSEVGDGSKLVEFHAVTASLQDLDVTGEDAVEACRLLVEQQLVEIASEPANLVALATEVPDETTALLLVNDVAAKRDLLSSCVFGETETALDYQIEVRFTHSLVARRLDDLGIDSRHTP